MESWRWRYSNRGSPDPPDVIPGIELQRYAERFVRSIKDECLDRVILLGERHLRLAIAEFVAHYHGERNLKAWVTS